MFTNLEHCCRVLSPILLKAFDKRKDLRPVICSTLKRMYRQNRAAAASLGFQVRYVSERAPDFTRTFLSYIWKPPSFASIRWAFQTRRKSRKSSEQLRRMTNRKVPRCHKHIRRRWQARTWRSFRRLLAAGCRYCLTRTWRAPLTNSKLSCQPYRLWPAWRIPRR